MSGEGQPRLGDLSGSASISTSAGGTLTVGPPIEIHTTPFDPEPRRENMRAILALLFVVAFLALIGLLVVGAALKWFDLATAKDVAAFALPPLTALTGTAVGFYYAGANG